MINMLNSTYDPKQWARDALARNPIIIDTETTGLGRDAEICELSAIDGRGNVLIDTLIKPSKPIPADATAIHGITNEMVADAPTWNEVEHMILALLINRHALIYNADYRGEWCDRRQKNRWHKLTDAAAHERVAVEGKAHRALADCRMTLGVLKAMAKSN